MRQGTVAVKAERAKGGMRCERCPWEVLKATSDKHGCVPRSDAEPLTTQRRRCSAPLKARWRTQSTEEDNCPSRTCSAAGLEKPSTANNQSVGGYWPFPRPC